MREETDAAGVRSSISEFHLVEEWDVPQRSSAHGRESRPAQAGSGEHSSPEVKKPEMFEDSANNSSALSEWIM